MITHFSHVIQHLSAETPSLNHGAGQTLEQHLNDSEGLLHSAQAMGQPYDAFRKKYTRLTGHAPKHTMLNCQMEQIASIYFKLRSLKNFLYLRNRWFARSGLSDIKLISSERSSNK